MASTEEVAPSGDEAESQFFCSPQSPGDESELQSFMVYSERDVGKPSEASDPCPHHIPAQYNDVEALESPGDSTSRTFTSFGENGTTVSANEYGDIMQITKYFGVGKSGFFCVDLPDQLEPWFVIRRAWNLLDYSTDSQQGIGLIIPEYFKGNPRLDFIHDRWPRYRTNTENLSIAIQYVIRNGVVIQKYTIKKRSADTVTFELQYKGLAIRQLEWMDGQNAFNMDLPSEPPSEGHNGDQLNTPKHPYQSLFGVDRRSFNLIHRFGGLVRQNEGQEDQTVQKPVEGLGVELSDGSGAAADRLEGAGEPNGETSRDKRNVEEERGQPGSDATRMPEAVGLTIAVFVNGKTQQFGENGAISVSMPEDSKCLDVTIAYRLQLLSSNENGWKASLISASDIYEPSLYPPRNHSPICFSLNRHVDFIIRRNLEHILSVCSINTATEFVWDTQSRLFIESVSKEPTFALTCGDFAGHYIVTSASFYAFRFLLEMFEFLKSPTSKDLSLEPSHAVSGRQKRQTSEASKMMPPQPTLRPHIYTVKRTHTEENLCEESLAYCNEQRDRILNVCKGHLRWVFQHAWKDGSAHFGGNHWPSGDPIVFPPEWSSAFKPSPSLADTPFQIIKAFEFARYCSDDDDADEAPRSKDKGNDQEVNGKIPAGLALSEQGKQLNAVDHESETAHESDNGQEVAAAASPENAETPKSSPKVSASQPATTAENSVFVGNRKFAKSLILNKVQPWVDDLALKNKRMKFAFNRSTDNGVSMFRLEDHVWIWMALRCLEDLKLENKLTPTASELLSDEQKNKITSKNAQKNILRRFTLEEPFLKQRLLATSRTVRESRFLFRSRDTALFYAMENGFFGSDQSRPVPWINSIEIQKHHELNDDAKWENPLRYGLAMIMTSNDEWKINQKPARTMFLDAARVLLYIARSNGLFLGEFEVESREPKTFSEESYRNSYWSSCFELPYILWKYGKESLDKSPETKPDLPLEEKDENSGDHFQVSPSTAKYIHEHMATGPAQLLEGASDGGSHTKGEPEAQNKTDPGAQKRARDTQAAIDALTVKKTMPFNDFIDQKSVVEPSDDWLYSFPNFLDFDPGIKTWENAMPKVHELLDLDRSDRHAGTDTLIADGAKLFQQGFESSGGAVLDQSFPTKVDQSFKGGIVDVPKSKHVRKGSPEKLDDSQPHFYLSSNEEIWQTLKNMRTEQNAKKRIIWLPFPDKLTALLCYLGSPESEHDAMIDFFDRHHGFDKYLYDDTIAAQNFWETELHLSFYQLLGTKGNTARQEDVLPPRQEITSPELAGKKIVRAAIGFRFFGDFLDRYWTCHVVECIPVQRVGRDFGGESSRFKSGPGTWKQRKVLELILFDMVLSEILEGVNDILKALHIRDEQPLPLSGISSNDYFRLRNRWQSLQYILQVLEDDLKESLEQIESWKTREVDRGQERPRWTKNDERKYRGPINKMLRSNERKVRKLKAYHTQIQSSRAKLLNTQQSVRDDLNFLGAEDIKYFTYVTVVFLPLGFAASIFSMSEAPPSVVLISMIVTAIAALLLTVFALISAKAISGSVAAISHGIYAAISSITSNSVLYKHYHDQHKPPPSSAQDATDQGERNHMDWISRNISHGLWLCWFWIAYITQELPGRQFAIAWKIWHPANRTATEGKRDPTLLQWIIAAWHTGFWVLQLPLKLGIFFVITLTGSVCWLAIGFARLFSKLKSPLALMVAVIFSPLFAVSYVVNLIWLNIYDTALWSVSQKSTERRTSNEDQHLQKEPNERPLNRVLSQQSSRSKSEKTSYQGESLQQLLVYSKAARPFQKYESKNKQEEGESSDSDAAMDIRTAMRSLFENPPKWPERKKRFGPFSV